LDFIWVKRKGNVKMVEHKKSDRRDIRVTVVMDEKTDMLLDRCISDCHAATGYPISKSSLMYTILSNYLARKYTPKTSNKRTKDIRKWVKDV